MEEDIDPIYGSIIDPREAYTIGKTKYSIYSLFEWFLTRKIFINPMSNDQLKQEEINELLERFKDFDLFPKIVCERVPPYKVIIIMEKYKLYKNTIQKNNESIIKFNNSIIHLYELINKALRRKDEDKGKKIAEKHSNLIKKIEGQIAKLEKINKTIEFKHDENIKLLTLAYKKN